MSCRLHLIAIFAIFTLVSCSKPGVRNDANLKQVSVRESSDKNNKNLNETTPTDISTSSFNDDLVHFELDTAIWNLISDQEGIQTYEKINSNDQVVAFRGEANIPAELTKIATVLNTPALRKEWIDSLAETHAVERISDLERIEYNRTKVAWPFEDRDFVFRANIKVRQAPPAMLIKMVSVKDDREPIRRGIVRGEMIYSYYYLKQVEGVRATKVVIEMAVDPKGAIPKWLVNASQKKWPYNTLLNLKKTAQREDIAISPEIIEFFSKVEKRGKKK